MSLLRKAFTNLFKSKSPFASDDGVRVLPDAGYNSAAEIDAVRALVAVNAQTGSGAGDSVVRVISQNGVSYALAWVNPHYLDPIAVRLFPSGMAEWCFTDTPDKTGPWRTDFTQSTLAPQMLAVLKAHGQTLFGRDVGPAPTPL